MTKNIQALSHIAWESGFIIFTLFIMMLLLAVYQLSVNVVPAAAQEPIEDTINLTSETDTTGQQVTFEIDTPPEIYDEGSGIEDINPTEQPDQDNVSGQPDIGDNWIEEFYRDYQNMQAALVAANYS